MTGNSSSGRQSEMRQEARLKHYERRRATGRLVPKVSWTRFLGALTLLLVTAAIGCCGPQATPAPPVVVRPVKPALAPDLRAQVAARWNEIAYVGSEVRMPADLWRLVSRATANGWANAKALERAGWGR